MSTPEQLDRLIDRQRQGQPVTPASPEARLTLDLMRLAESFDLDPAFDADLGARLHRPVPTYGSLRIVRAVVVSAAAFALIVLAVVAVPPLRAVAQGIIDTLFPPAAIEEQTIAFAPGEAIAYESVTAAQADVAYPIRVPSALPDGIELVTIVYYPERSTTSFSLHPPEGGPLHYTIHQQPVEAAEREGPFIYNRDAWTIGQDAESQPIMIGGIEGAFVRGSWVTGGRGADAVYRWDSRFPVYTLRWAHEGMLYEVSVFTQPDDFDLYALMRLAASMME